MNHVQRLADSAGAISPELAAQERARQKAIRRVSKLREKASAEIERLISFLDECDPYVMHELEEDGEREDGGDVEPSLGSFDRMIDQSKSWRQGRLWEVPEVDAELDTADDEPNLGSLERSCCAEGWGDGRNPSGDQSLWGYSARADLEEQCDDEGSAA